MNPFFTHMAKSPRQPFSEFADDKHQEQAEEVLLCLGGFAVAFERVCEAIRHAIVLIFQSEGLKRVRLAEAVIGDKGSAELQVLLGALFVGLSPKQDEEDIRAVQKLLAEVKTLTEERNIIIHSSWRFGETAALSELYATSIRPRAELAERIRGVVFR